jgi:hypothetical protein
MFGLGNVIFAGGVVVSALVPPALVRSPVRRLRDLEDVQVTVSEINNGSSFALHRFCSRRHLASGGCKDAPGDGIITGSSL